MRPDAKNPEDKRIRQWARARGPISNQGGRQAHLSAFAYASDTFLLGTVYRAHSVPRFSSGTALRRLDALKNQPSPDTSALNYFQSLADLESAEMRGRADADREVGMMVSLSHSIYFHAPEELRVDEWMLSEMETPWAGDGRGLVISRWWARSGVLLATCVQEVSNLLSNTGLC